MSNPPDYKAQAESAKELSKWAIALEQAIHRRAETEHILLACDHDIEQFRGFYVEALEGVIKIAITGEFIELDQLLQAARKGVS